MSSGDILGSLVSRSEGLFAFGVYDAMSAKMAELASHEAIYVGGYAAAGSRMLPDMGLLTMTEMISHIKFIAQAVTVPLIVDIDDGYGNANNVIRTVSELLTLPNIGVFHIEDQCCPKRCGHIKGKDVLPVEEFVGKLKAAIDTKNRINPSCKVIARTDAFSAVGGKKDEKLGGDADEAIKRLVVYADAGADYLWCEFPTPSLKSAYVVASGIRKYHPQAILAFNVSPSFPQKDWLASDLSEADLNDMGYKLRFSTYPALMVAMRAVHQTALGFRCGAINAIRCLKDLSVGTLAESVMKVVDVDWYLANERKYNPRGAEKQSFSEGFGSSDPKS